MFIASWSGGKDSTATIILAHENNEPLDKIIFSEVMFDENTSGELPEQIEFIQRCIPIFESWGYPVEILHSDKTFISEFYSTVGKSKYESRIGMFHGFPMGNHCAINDRCKIRPIRQFNKQHKDAIHYVGIAIDEPKRLERMGDKKISLLAKYGFTEKMAFDLCKKYDMLSPCYAFAKRGGCWFCPNAHDPELKHIRKNHNELWRKLLELEDVPNKVGYCWNTLTNTSIHDKEKLFQFEDAQCSLIDI